MDLTKALREAMTPQWLKDLDRNDISKWGKGDFAEVVGTLLGLMDRCRRHMPADEWKYVHGEIVKEWGRHAGLDQLDLTKT